MMRWTLPLVAALLAPLAPVQDKDAEDAYREFEKKLTSVKAFRVNIDIQSEEQKVKVKGEMTVAPGNKLKIVFSGTQGDMPISASLLSDGKTVAMKFASGDKGETKSEPTHADMQEFLLGFFAKTGLLVGMDKGTRPMPEFNPNKLTLTNFKMVGKEKVGDRETRIIQFNITVPNEKDQPTCKLWLDTQSQMPLKRQLEVEVNGKVIFRVTELYSQWVRDPVLKNDEFTVPK